MTVPVAHPDSEGVRAVIGDVGEVYNCENCGWWIYKKDGRFVHYSSDDREC